MDVVSHRNPIPSAGRQSSNSRSRPGRVGIPSPLSLQYGPQTFPALKRKTGEKSKADRPEPAPNAESIRHHGLVNLSLLGLLIHLNIAQFPFRLNAGPHGAHGQSSFVLRLGKEEKGGGVSSPADDLVGMDPLPHATSAMSTGPHLYRRPPPPPPSPKNPVSTIYLHAS